MVSQKVKQLEEDIAYTRQLLLQMENELENELTNFDIEECRNQYFTMHVGGNIIYFYVDEPISLTSEYRLVFKGLKFVNNYYKGNNYNFISGNELEFPVEAVTKISKEEFYLMYKRYLDIVEHNFKPNETN